MSLQIIKKPVVTEKSIALANQDNMFTFEVDRQANKHQVAQAISQLYGVKVLKVHSISRSAQTIKTGKKRVTAQTARTKKAVVTLAKDHKIDLFDTK